MDDLDLTLSGQCSIEELSDVDLRKCISAIEKRKKDYGAEVRGLYSALANENRIRAEKVRFSDKIGD